MASTGASRGTSGHSGGPVLVWGTAAAGLLAAWAWLASAPAFAETLAGSVAGESLAVMLVVFYLVVFVPIGLLAIVLARVLGLRAGKLGRAPVAGIVGGMGLGTGALALALALTSLAIPVEDGGQATGPGALVALGFLLIALQVLAEELLVRGWLQTALALVVGPAIAIVAASIAFAMLHLVAAEASALALINITLAGVLFGALRWVSGGIALPTAAHFGWNALEDVGLGAFPNPGVGGFGAVLDVDLLGPVEWGGGPQGLNASIGTSVVLLALVLIVAALAKRPPAQ